MGTTLSHTTRTTIANLHETLVKNVKSALSDNRETHLRRQAKVLGGKRTLKELAEKVKVFNNSERKDSRECRKIIGDFMNATHIHEIRIPGVLHGGFESFWQAERNGPMLPGPRNYLIELDWNNHCLVIKKRAYIQAARRRNKWFVEQVIPLNRIQKIKIVRVPAGLRHLEIQLHTPCPD